MIAVIALFNTIIAIVCLIYATTTLFNILTSLGVQAISTIIQAISIVFLVILTARYVKKTSELARKETRPKLKLTYHMLSPGKPILAVINAGKGASLENNISLSYILKGAKKEKNILYPYLGVNESLEIMDVLEESIIEDITAVEKITATFTYKDIENEEYKEEDIVYPKKFWESAETKEIMYKKPPIERIANALEKIQKELEKLRGKQDSFVFKKKPEEEQQDSSQAEK